MGVKLSLECSGCENTAEGKLTRIFRGSHGNWGFGSWVFEPLDVPDGWVPFDPLTNTTYCPECYEEIFG